MKKANTARRERRGQDKILAAHAQLFGAATELRALAHLFETQGQKANEIALLDRDLVGHGLGRIFKRLAREIRWASEVLNEPYPER